MACAQILAIGIMIGILISSIMALIIVFLMMAFLKYKICEFSANLYCYCAVMLINNYYLANSMRRIQAKSNGVTIEANNALHDGLTALSSNSSGIENEEVPEMDTNVAYGVVDEEMTETDVNVAYGVLNEDTLQTDVDNIVCSVTNANIAYGVVDEGTHRTDTDYEAMCNEDIPETDANIAYNVVDRDAATESDANIYSDVVN